MIPFRFLKLIFNKKNELPVYLIHSVTEKCNAYCKHCFVKTTEDQQNELTPAEIEAFCPSLGKNLYEVCLTGGEPFLRDDLVEIANAYLKKTPVRVVQISTNGLLTDKIIHMTKKILCIDPKKIVLINLSIDGLHEQHDQIRGLPGLFDCAIKTHLELAKLKKPHSNLLTNINITISKSNENDLVDLFDYLINVVNTHNITTTLVRGAPRNFAEKNVSMGKYYQFTTYMEKKLRNQQLPGYENIIIGNILNAQNIIARKRILKTINNNKYIAPCYAGNLSGVIGSNGNVYPCELIKEPLGNLRDNNFKDIWLGNKTKTIREHNKRCFCTHECFLLVNILFNLQYLPALLKEACFLETRRLKAKILRGK